MRFMRNQHASKASWDGEGRLVSIELDPLPAAPPTEPETPEPQPTPETPDALRRRIALGAVGGLRRVPR